MRPSAIIPPQVTEFGSPRPRKESADSVRIAPATMTAVTASTGGRASGMHLPEGDLGRMHADDAGGGDEVGLAED